MLGGRLAQRQAALREVMAAGSRCLLLIPCLPLIYQAVFVPEKLFFWKRGGISNLLTLHEGDWHKRQVVEMGR
jgi:hypothetical protein